uniref:K Homology domain-containing protein n=1 Tax=Arcella intermedia TaxID=1963864 RepID=A0A6B2LIB9_9EUKA
MDVEDDTPNFPPLKPSEMTGGVLQNASIPIPRHRLHPLKENWMAIYQPLIEQFKLQIRFNTATRCIELRTSDLTQDIGAIQKATDFIRAFILGFDVQDAIALLRMDDLFIDSFDVEDVKRLQGDHLSRAIGRVAGKDGKTKFTIENATKTRIVLADRRVHILGSFSNIKLARDAVCQLILGSPPGQVYGKLRIVSSRMNERF